MFSTPILFLIFNRPEVTQKVFERIREVKPEKLYVAADGPRKDKNGEDLLCKQTRAIINLVDWQCEVFTLYRDTNLGCGKGVSEAITWFFNHEEMGIILEDDVLPNISFFDYCTTMLHHYKSDSKVMHINGCNFQQGVKRSDGSYYLSAFPHVWGWATWRRAWKSYDFNLSDLNYFYNLKKLNYYFKDKAVKEHWYEIFFKMNRKWMDTWDYQWNYAIWNQQGKVVTPNVNLITNLGFGEGATHTTDKTSKFAELKTEVLQDIKHPLDLNINTAADQHTFEYCN